MQPRFLIREAHLYELEEIRKFYQDNDDPHVMFRADPDVKRAINDGVFFLALDVQKPEGERIVGASAVYTVDLKTHDRPIVLKESGGSLVSDAYKGYGLHKVFHAARALHEFILDRGGFQHYFGAIICPNPNSEKNIQASGFIPWPDPPDALIQQRAPFAGPDQQIRFFELTPDGLPPLAQLLLETAEVSSLTNSRTGSVCQLEMPVQLLRMYRPIVAQIAQGDVRRALET